MKRWILAIACSAELIRMYQCEIACRFSGYDTGSYRDKNCLCVDKKPYTPFVQEKKLSFPRKGPKASGKMEVYYDRGPDLRYSEDALDFYR